MGTSTYPLCRSLELCSFRARCSSRDAVPEPAPARARSACYSADRARSRRTQTTIDVRVSRIVHPLQRPRRRHSSPRGRLFWCCTRCTPPSCLGILQALGTTTIRRRTTHCARLRTRRGHLRTVGRPRRTASMASHPWPRDETPRVVRARARRRLRF